MTQDNPETTPTAEPAAAAPQEHCECVGAIHVPKDNEVIWRHDLGDGEGLAHGQVIKLMASRRLLHLLVLRMGQETFEELISFLDWDKKEIGPIRKLIQAAIDHNVHVRPKKTYIKALENVRKTRHSSVVLTPDTFVDKLIEYASPGLYTGFVGEYLNHMEMFIMIQHVRGWLAERKEHVKTQERWCRAIAVLAKMTRRTKAISKITAPSK
jgi:hypothetical protein